MSEPRPTRNIGGKMFDDDGRFITDSLATQLLLYQLAELIADTAEENGLVIERTPTISAPFIQLLVVDNFADAKRQDPLFQNDEFAIYKTNMAGADSVYCDFVVLRQFVHRLVAANEIVGLEMWNGREDGDSTFEGLGVMQ